MGLKKLICVGILIVLLVFLGVQIYEGTKTNRVIISNMVTDGKYIYVDMSMQPLHCDEDYIGYNTEEHCVDVSEDKICKYNLDYIFTGECWDK